MRPRSLSRRDVLLGSLGAACALMAPTGAFARQASTYAAPDDLGGYGRANAINGSGQVAGLSGSTAASWDAQGQYTDLGAWSGDSSSEAFAINDAGVIVGASWSASYQPHAVVWSQGQIFDLGALAGGTESMALAINGRNQVVGWSAAADRVIRAVTWDLESGQLADLGTIVGGSHAEATGINDAGLVVGWADAADGARHAFRLDGTSATDLGTATLALAVNGNGQVAGIANASGTSGQAARWDEGSAQAATIGADGASSRAVAINDAGSLVGASAQGGAEQARLWDAGGQEVPLDGLPDTDPATDATAAHGINASGIIAGESGGRPVVWHPA